MNSPAQIIYAKTKDSKQFMLPPLYTLKNHKKRK